MTGLVALAVVTSVVLAGVGGAAATQMPDKERDGRVPTLQDEEDNGTLSPADEVYVKDDGDVVLLYESDAEDLTSGHYSVDVSAGLLHALAVTETDDEFNGSASATAVLEQSRLAANGSLTVQRPGGLESLDLQVSGASTTEESTLDATFEAAFATDEAPSTQLVSSASTSGRLVTTGTALTTQGQAEVQFSQQFGEAQLQSFTLRESGDTYTIEAEQDYTVAARQRERWNTSERARQTLRAMYGAVADELGGDVTVTLQAHSFEETDGRDYRLHLVYTVEYTGIDEGLTRIIGRQLAESRQFDLTREEARAVGQRIADLRVDHVSFTFDQSPQSASLTWSARIENYNEIALAMADVIEAIETGEDGGEDMAALNSFLPDPEKIRDRVEARRETNLTQRITWSGELNQPSRQRTTLSAELHVDTENRAAYVDAIQERGIKTTNLTFDLSARTEGEEVLASASVEMDRRRMLDEGINVVLNATAASDMNPRARRALEAFQRAELQRAKMDFSLEDDTARIELGAKFEDLSAFRDVVVASGEAPAITGVAGEVDGETTTSYVHVEGAVSADASESDVRALAYVDDETVVHMPGTYNRTFPQPNSSAAREYLGLPSPTPTPGGPTGGLAPGFGPVVALVAMAAAVALLARRRST